MTVIARWIDRGAVRPDAPVELIAGIVPTAFGSVTLPQRALELETVAELVDQVLLPALCIAPASGTDV